MTQPNFLFILTDQQRFDTIGANGSVICKTPHLDTLASEGVRFNNAWTVTGLCTPARASIYTGVWPHRHGLTRNEGAGGKAAIPEDFPTVAEHLAARNYQSHFTGKWHAGSRMPGDCGFEGMNLPGYGNIWKYEGYHEHLKENGLDVPQLKTAGTGWSNNLILAGVMSGPVEASIPYYLAQDAIGFLENRPDEAPFLLALNFWGPHAPYTPCEPYASMYDPKSIPPWGNFNDTFEGKPPIYRRYRDAFIGEGNPLRSWDECARWAALYYGYTTQIDDQIGRVMNALKRLGLDQNTIVLFTADHGDPTGCHGGMHDKNGIMCQEVYHIPMIVKDPRNDCRGLVSDLPASNMDITPTIIDMAGCTVPENLDGKSLAPIIQGQTPDHWPDYAAAECFGTHFAYETRMIVHAGHKYIFHPGAFDELYDLDSDPWEMKNLIEDPGKREMLEQLRHRLLTWIEKSGDSPTIASGLFDKRPPDTSIKYEDLLGDNKS